MQGRMFEDVRFSKFTVARLEHIFESYHLVACSNPHKLRAKIPTKEIWRFFVDGVTQQNGWLPYEKREAGYLRAASMAFDHIFHSEHALSSELIKTIHFLATNQVESTNYEGSCADHVGEYRSKHNDQMFFGLEVGRHGNATLDGLRETVLKKQFMQSEFFTIDIPVLQRYILLTRQKLMMLRNTSQDDLQMSIQSLLYNDDVDLAQLPVSFQRRLYRIFRAFAVTKTKDELVTVLHDIAKQAYSRNVALSYCSAQDHKTHRSLNLAMAQLIVNYNKGISQATDPFDKLIVMVKFIRSCMQKHPFVDGNCRTFCMMLLNYLLLQNGFPFSIPNDPNRYSMYSVKQMVIETIHGMDNVFRLIKKESLYQVRTEDFINDLKRPREVDAAQSLKVVIDSEEAAREQFAKKMKKT